MLHSEITKYGKKVIERLLPQELTHFWKAPEEKWRENPFNPHLIARLRLVAYQKAAVMKYLDNLIAWGDSLFGRDTIETVNEATQLYILAANILGPRPQSALQRQRKRRCNRSP